MNSESRICKNCEKGFTIEPEDFSFYKKLGVPPPSWCSNCRFIRKLTFLNERSLYKRVCGRCQAPTISMYDTEAPFPVWCVKCHIKDDWDGRDYERDYDFSRNFFEQFQDLKNLTPHRALEQNEKNGEGCEYANFCFRCKNVYLSFLTVGDSENIKYSRCFLRNNKNCLDSLIVQDNDRGYELVQAIGNYNSSFLIESDQCIESHFLYDCSNCLNCSMSSNLRNKSYAFRNKQLSKEEYQKAITALSLGKYEGQLRAKEEFADMAKKAIHKYAHIKNSVNTVGDFIENSKNAYHCYALVDSENVKNIFLGVSSLRDSQDLILAGRLEECYEFTSGGRGGSRIVLSFSCGGGSRNLFYCYGCRTCSDCFGCVSLDKKQYCIFNRQYSKEEYENLVPKIIKHMDEIPYIDKIGRKYTFGEYFPTELSSFAYNETIAFEEYPMTRERVLSSGYKWKDLETKSYASTFKSRQLPDDIKDVKDSICDEIIECPNQGQIETQCTSAYRILPDELSFYRQMNLPIPRYCPNCRYHQRLVWKNPFHFYERECMCELSNHDHDGKCTNAFETMYAPNRPEKIYCKECYQKEVY
ncbi:hypothetical protein A3A05_02285 [Candidatus Nomurabacteria bacterium RIFCSPLOWO2_01_FULL_41_12]|uniref:Uncharacterized protein n=1 Tax=Candidatus Nomurabacteria bacterium RIFCSPLOWO2_01_FULL_41_12 TaxID=1801774 RepID=A0A1F6WUI5_9BACT|nr:MAG: hypothetical protein A2732_02205 [Candidatus Nomurabacteria bacterium RIFCSPHIGHO2_01_FULL_40_10]OGI85541.1 MAG: hypothetical protein A3A05_02285 [Candidatus Nomurabacteria bacterium RIFCSPLOWO2_01_FULL_41_12]